MEENKQEKPEQKIKKPQIVLLSVFAMVVLFLLAFGCYGCSYQSPEVPDEMQAVDVLSSLAHTSWELDTAMGETSLEELGGMVLQSLSFAARDEEASSLAVDLLFSQSSPLPAQVVYEEEQGFSLVMENQPLGVEIVYSQSRDGQTETITLVGETSNVHCYYLKI